MVAGALIIGAGVAAAAVLLVGSDHHHIVVIQKVPSNGPSGVAPKQAQSNDLSAGQAIATVKAQGYLPESMKGFTASGPLRVIIAQNKQAADSAQKAFFFFGTRYLGTDTSYISKGVSFNFSSGTTIGLNYALYNIRDAECCPTDGSVTVRFHWNGQRLVPLDPIPTSDDTVNGSRR